MRMRVALVLLGALFAFFGATVLLEGSALASELPSQNAAPLCDDRAASAYAADPAPQPVDSGDVTATPDGCKTQMVASADAAQSHDDLHKVPQVPVDPASIVPTVVEVPASVAMPEPFRAIAIDGFSEEHRDNDNPPPRPIPWRG